jgi:chromosome segregation ATPase
MAKRVKKQSLQAQVKHLNAEVQDLISELRILNDTRRSLDEKNYVQREEIAALQGHLRKADSQVNSINNLAGQAMMSLEQLSGGFAETQRTINTLLLRLVPDPAATSAPKPAHPPFID